MKEPKPQWAKLEKAMVYSPAYQNLKLNGRRILDHVLFQLRWENTAGHKSKKPNFTCSNKKEILIPYSVLSKSPFNMVTSSITRGIDDLLYHGFISVLSQGGSQKEHTSIYAFIDKWKSWKKGAPSCEERKPYRARGYTDKNKHSKSVLPCIQNE